MASLIISREGGKLVVSVKGTTLDGDGEATLSMPFPVDHMQIFIRDRKGRYWEIGKAELDIDRHPPKSSLYRRPPPGGWPDRDHRP